MAASFILFFLYVEMLASVTSFKTKNYTVLDFDPEREDTVRLILT